MSASSQSRRAPARAAITPQTRQCASMKSTMTIVLALFGSLSGPAWAGCTASGGSLGAWFSPRGGGTAEAVRQTGLATGTILVEAYVLSSTTIAGALATAHRRGVHVEAVIDRSSTRWEAVQSLAMAGATVWVDTCHAIMHDKVFIIDGRVIVTGSFNFSVAAENRNAENLLVIRNAALASCYQVEWRRLRDCAQRLATP